MRTHTFAPFYKFDRRDGLPREGVIGGEGTDPRYYPHIVPMKKPSGVLYKIEGTPLAMQAIEQDLYAVSAHNGQILLHRIRDGKMVSVSLGTGDTETRRELVQFNRYTNPADPLSGEYEHLGLLFPDALCFDLDAEELTVAPLATEEGQIPCLEHVTVAHSRLFGSCGDRLYVSAYNDPTDWRLDTAADAGAANAWASTVQSNTLSSGAFTALTTYDGAVLAFKESFCHIVYGNKNPFRVGDLFAYGTPDRRTVAEVGGCLYFADRRGIYRYNGDTVEEIGAPLALGDLSGAVATAHGDLYYLASYYEGDLCAYSPATGAWGCLPPWYEVSLAAMAAGAGGCYALDEDGQIWRVDGEENGAFTVTCPYYFGEGDFLTRLSRIYFTVTAYDGSRFEAYYFDFSRRSHLILKREDSEGMGGTQRWITRTFTPADGGGRLLLTGEGNIRLHEITLAIQDAGT